MDIGRLVRELESRETSRAASDALVAHGPAAVGPVLRELTDESSPVEWSTSAWVLRRMGEVSFDPLVEAMAVATTPEVRRRLGWAFQGYGAALLDRYVAALAHPAAAVREQAAIGVQFCGADGMPAAPALLELLGDPEKDVAGRAMFVLSQLGPALIPALRRIRAEGPGRRRAGALTVLAALGGEAALSERDRAAVERLIRVKLLDDSPQAPETCWLHWMAVPTGDQAGVMAELGLSEPRAVTFALGNDVVDTDGHDGGGFGRVFVTPELNGWTFVVGRWCDPAGAERREEVRGLCAALSKRYGQAQAYYLGEQGDGSGWLVARDGTVVRHWWTAAEDEEDDDAARGVIGAPLPYEVARRAALETEEDPEDVEDAWEWATAEMAPEVAGSEGFNLLAVGPGTPVRGTGVVALTPQGAAEGHPPGAHRI
ncbi:HEAT repeat domain-containing protein [Streptomyces avicenniae]|uniref:HEAT repeat domain-containing protein n=1 Tax=Streptomyces avicenniae TaxID=500153 RepID=UPI00069A1136|nr:hypothetical protein [Streptomyces avicenniae]